MIDHMWHVSLTCDRQTIETEGLSPQTPAGGWPAGVYLFADQANAEFFADWKAEIEQDNGGDVSDVDIWRVDVRGLALVDDPAVSADDEFQDEYPVQPLRSVYVADPIPAARLDLAFPGEL